jgi:hypothetical protein
MISVAVVLLLALALGSGGLLYARWRTFRAAAAAATGPGAKGVGDPVGARRQERSLLIVHSVVTLILLVLAVALHVSGGAGFLDPPRPTLLPDDFRPPVVPTSLIAAPVKIPLAPLTALLEGAVPTTWGDLSERMAMRGRSRTEVALQLRRDPFHVTLHGEEATVSTTIHYGLRVFYDPPLLPEVSGSCGLGEDTSQAPRLAVAIRAPVSVDSTWTLRTGARVMDIRPLSDSDRDRCLVTFLDFDLTGRVTEAARDFLEKHVDDIDSLAAEVDVRGPFQGWWATLREPIELTDSLWLSMGPEALQRGPVQGFGDSLQIALALRARPTVTFGARPEIGPEPLPSLAAGEVREGLDLLLEARARYDAVSALLRDVLVGREFNYGERTLRVDSLQVFGIGAGRLAVEIEVSGDVSARLFLVGTPEVEAETGRIFVPDLDFDVATRNVVLAAVSWIRAEEFRDVLRERARFPAGPAVDWLTGWLAEGLNRDLSDDLTVEGEVDSVRILGVHALREALVIQVAAQGRARLLVTGGGGPR